MVIPPSSSTWGIQSLPTFTPPFVADPEPTVTPVFRSETVSIDWYRFAWLAAGLVFGYAVAKHR